MLLSVIVPVFNTAEYIDECLNSIYKLNSSEIELIIINDGSTDNSYECVSKYSSFQNTVILAQENCGLSATRNRGIGIAKGEFIMFLDSDYRLETEKLDELLEIIKKHRDVDIFTIGFTDYPNNDVYNLYLDNQTAVEHYLTRPNKTWPAVQYIVSKKTLRNNSLSFKEGYLHEDICWTVSVMLVCGKAISTGINCYVQRNDRMGSITSTPNVKRLLDCWQIVNESIEKIQLANFDNDLKKKISNRLVQAATSLLWIYCKVDKADRTKILNAYDTYKDMFMYGTTLKIKLFNAMCRSIGFEKTVKLLKG